MRRSTHYLPAVLTIAASIAAWPAGAHAQDEPAVSADGATPPEPVAPTAPPTTESPPDTTTTAPPTTTTTAPPTTTTPAPPESAPATTTTVPAPPTTTTDTTTTGTTQPEVTTPTAPETTPTTSVPPEPSPTTPREPAPAAPPIASADSPSDGATSDGAPTDDELDVDAHAALPDGIVRSIVFPVLGPVQYGNDWGACRDDCTRRHQGTDLLGVRMQPLVAAVNGTVTRVRYESVGTAGTVITITGADGWYYNYFHVNNDTPGTDDGAAAPEWRIAPGVTIGSAVRAGQVIAYMGDSGNTEGSVPHLHFEIRRPDRVPVNPYHSLRDAQRNPACAPAGSASLVTDPSALSQAVIAVIPLDGGGRWLIDRHGRVFAEGSAADMWGGCAADVAAPVVAAPAPASPSPAAIAPAAIAAPVAPPVTPAPPTPPRDAATTWTVEPGDSLWEIAVQGYGVSEVGAIVSMVNLVFDSNRDQLIDPNVLNVGAVLQLPASGA